MCIRDRFITGVDGLERAIAGLRAAIKFGLRPKVNMVVLRGVNESEVWDMIRFGMKLGVNIQLIELLNIDPVLFKKYYASLGELERELQQKAVKIGTNVIHGRPRYYLSDNFYVELVRSIKNPLFCMRCDRIRITHDGKFKTCIMRNDRLVDFLSYIRSGASDEVLEMLFRKAVELREPFYKV